MMTPSNPRWNEFIEKLLGSEGCNMIETIPGDPKSITWQCDHQGFEFTKAILEKMDGIDISATLQYFRDHGGKCDCLILLNVDPY